MSDLTPALSSLITASHILHHQSILDSMGHVSLRNPYNPSTFFLPLQMGPAVVSGLADIGEYLVDDGSPFDDNAKKGPNYVERFIHSEILKRYPDMTSVVHSHSEDVLPFTVLGGGDDDGYGRDGGGVRLEMEPVYHMAGFLGSHTPIFDITPHYPPNATHDLLINAPFLGAALASTFGQNSTTATSPAYQVVLQRGHGFVVAGTSIEQAVMYAYYACSNARVQTKALLLHNAIGGCGKSVSCGKCRNGNGGEEGNGGEGVQIQYLSGKERVDCKGMNDWIAFKPWKQWVREVDPKRNPLYDNDLGDPPT